MHQSMPGQYGKLLALCTFSLLYLLYWTYLTFTLCSYMYHEVEREEEDGMAATCWVRFVVG